ncbi:transcription termination factor Rho [Fretibacterium sp. OH1220_COT-178]|uniref:transcription termination factor Rho n=1 Tax=Fretibacterium sp. OH1220_COT-178 TaxID=2491047 RepID=UPI000F5EEC63|nr:transcription termination factor Rho [Fretibacterium sp. OH1220_COT-178]RRD66186.1 transcription termination factor Rho [Fretibacterium sp. OH1220_COT-178]
MVRQLKEGAAPKKRGRPAASKAHDLNAEPESAASVREVPEPSAIPAAEESGKKAIRPRGRPRKAAPPEAEAKAVTDSEAVDKTRTAESSPLPPDRGYETESAAVEPSVKEPAIFEAPAPSPVESPSHPKPKHTYGYLASQTLADLRRIGRELNAAGASTLRKDDLIIAILRAQAESMNYRFGGGTLEILPEGFGFLRPKGMLPTDNDVYLSVSQIRRFGLRNGDVIWGLIRPPRELEHYEALLRVETVNFSDPEHSRRRPQFGQLTPIFPNVRINLETGPGDWATRLVDMFAPIGMGQRALIVSPPKAGKTTLLKRIAKAISSNYPDVILMALLIDERPEEVTDISRSVDGEVIASTFDRPADEHIRVANLALEKAKRLAEAKRDVVILLDSITRLARASNLTVPPSGRTLSGGLDPSGLYFPKRFFGAARNFEEGGSLTIIGTALTDTGSRMDDVIYEEFKGTGNMELHLSRKLAEQRIFPAIDITRSGTRREELLIPEDELARLWVLRKRIVSVDEAGALNLILDKLRQTRNNREFLMSIKLL